MAPAFDRTLEWDYDIIEFGRIDFGNIEVTATIDKDAMSKAAQPSKIPFQINVEVIRRPPKDEYGTIDTILTKTSFPLVFVGEKEGKILYRNESQIVIGSDILPSASKDGRISVASFRREDEPPPPEGIGKAESDRYFRGKRNFVNRGAAVGPGPDKSKERPPPKLLILAGGVEVLELRVLRDTYVQVLDNQATDKILIRSPADIFYYTGHGHSNRYSPPGVLKVGRGNYVRPEEVLDAWKNYGFVMKILIIAGCAVISIYELKKDNPEEFAGTERKGVGMRWSQLLTSRGGPVEQIYGYWGGSPADNKGGNAVAGQIGDIIANDINGNHAVKWLELHKSLFGRGLTTASSMTGNEFRRIVYPLIGDPDIVTELIIQ